MKSRYQIKTLVCMRCSLLSLICRKRKQRLAEALLRDLRTTRSPSTMVTIPFLKDLPSLAMQAGTNRVLLACTSPSMLGGNLPTCTSPSMLVGSSSLFSMLRAPGIRAQEEVSSGHQGRHMSFSAYGYHDQHMGYHEQ